MKKLGEIIEHPYFRHHVTELLYDASEYHTDLVDPSEYMDRVLSFCSQHRTFSDNECRKRAKEDARVFRRVLEIAENEEIYVEDLDAIAAGAVEDDDAQPKDADIDGAEVEAADDDNLATTGDIVFDNSDPPDHPGATDSAESSTPDYGLSPDSDQSGEGDFYHREEYYRLGCYKGAAEYRRMYEQQEQIGGYRAAINMLRRVFKQCPKVFGVVFTDFRSLARSGETFDGMCTRLFGNTMEPMPVLGNASHRHEFVFLVNQIEASGRRLRSFTIGGHMFEKHQENTL